MSKGIPEFSIWQKSPSLAFLFLKIKCLLSLICYSLFLQLRPEDPTIWLTLRYLAPATHSVPAWKSSSLWMRQGGQTLSPAEERVYKWTPEPCPSRSISNLQAQTASFKSHCSVPPLPKIPWSYVGVYKMGIHIEVSDM